MRLDHIAYRVEDRIEAANLFSITLGYSISPTLPDGFDVQFEDGSLAKCLVLEAPEGSSERATRVLGGLLGEEYHAAPEIFVSDGSDNSIVSEWVRANGPGVHHLAYEVDSVEEYMKKWGLSGIEFATKEPLRCDGLVQAFTAPNPITGTIYELIERQRQGFCKENVRELMNSTAGLQDG
jgi:catechol 2,3-dioxygenase-like lactoylglutathione lyase family enzyme